MIPSVRHSRKDKIIETVKNISGCQGFRETLSEVVRGEKGRLGGAKGIFKVVKVFHVKLEWCIHDIMHLSVFTELCNTKREPQYNL